MEELLYAVRQTHRQKVPQGQTADRSKRGRLVSAHKVRAGRNMKKSERNGVYAADRFGQGNGGIAWFSIRRGAVLSDLG